MNPKKEKAEVVVIRKNILDDEDVRNKYIQGVKLLKNDFLKSGWNNTYDIFVIWHYVAMMTPTPSGTTDGRNAAHRGPSFLPWHRWMLLLFENHLQRVLDDRNFGLPYWDWAATGELPPNQQPLAPIWSNNCMGGSGTPVSNGPFAVGLWHVSITEDLDPDLNPFLIPVEGPLRGLHRSLGNGSYPLPTKAQVRAAVHKGEPNVLYDIWPWNASSNGFRKELENAPLHNRIHNWTGGDMMDATSPNDPLFYLNHCNVDRIWAGWQNIHNNPIYLPDADASEDLQFHRLNDPLFRITTDPATFGLFDPIYNGSVKPADLLDISTLYSYDTFDDLV